MTKYVVNDHTKQTSVWGPVDDEVKKELQSAFKEFDMTQSKLSAFFLLNQALIEMGPAYIDNYVRTVLSEAIFSGLEAGIVSGTGKDMPIGMDRDLSNMTNGVYAQKTAVALTSFEPAAYGAVIAPMAKNTNGLNKKFSSVILVINMTTYLTKVMPATTMAIPQGGYARDVFAFPTEVIISNEIDDNKGVLAIAENYFCGVGMGTNGNVTYSDEYKFLEDYRTYKAKLYAAGRLIDNTDSVFLDLSGLEALAYPVKVKGTVTLLS